MNTYLYGYQDKLYINLTNLCSNNCDFCVRNTADGVGGHNLWLEKEPSSEEIVASLKELNLDKYREFVFCGFGEPLYAFEKLVEIGRFLRKKGKKTRLNTNGQASLIIGRETVERIDVLKTPNFVPLDKLALPNCGTNERADGFKNPLGESVLLNCGTDEQADVLKVPLDKSALSNCGADERADGLKTPNSPPWEGRKGGATLEKTENTDGCFEKDAICKSIVGILRGAVDTVSISLNASNAERYNEICRCAFGEDGFYSMLEFAGECVGKIQRVILSVVDTIGAEEIEKCGKIAEKIGAELRVRKYSAT